MKDEHHISLAFVSGTANDGVHALLKSVLPDKLVYSEPGLKVLQPAAGVLVELYGSGGTVPQYVAGCCGPLVSFRVDCLDTAIRQAEKYGAILMLKAKDPCTGFSFCHLQLNTRYTIGFFQY